MGPPPDGDPSSAPAGCVVPQAARCPVLTASGLLLGAETRVRTACGLGPSAPSSSAGVVSRVWTTSGPGPATAGDSGPGLCVRISRDVGPPGLEALEPDSCSVAPAGTEPSGAGAMPGGRSQTALARAPGDSLEMKGGTGRERCEEQK